jgi:hypothetical protein
LFTFWQLSPIFGEKIGVFLKYQCFDPFSDYMEVILVKIAPFLHFGENYNIGPRYDGVCDKDGCDFASYRMNDHTFFGRGSGFAIDTTQKEPIL